MSRLDTVFPADFRASLTGPARRFFFQTAFASVGNGLTLSLFVVYLHVVRHLSLGYTTTLLGVNALVGLAFSPLWGTLTDRFGPIRPMMISLVGGSVGGVLWAFASTTWSAAFAVLLMSIFGGGAWGPASTLLSRLIEPEHRQRAFGVNFMLVNVGIGFGGLISASVVNLHHPRTFEFLYLANVGVSLVTFAVVASLWRHGQALPREVLSKKEREEGWRTVLKDRRLVHYVFAALILLIAGYGSQEAGFSLFVVRNLHMAPSSIGVIFFFNTTTIVIMQLLTLHFIDGRSRTMVMGGVGILWSLFWIIVQITTNVGHGVALVMLCGGMVVFALGETMWSPVGTALVNDIAPEHLRGRYNAASGLVWGVSSALAPFLTGLFLGSSVENLWPGFVAVLALIGGGLALTLRRSLTPAEDGRIETSA